MAKTWRTLLTMCEATSTLGTAMARSKRQEKIVPNFSLRSIRNHVINPAMMKIAGSRRSPISLICHIGRRSGKRYANPIIAEPTNDGFIFALTYGPTVDWYRNCLAAGHCSLQWHGTSYELEKPQDVNRARALRVFPLPERLMLRLLGTDHFVGMKRSGG